MKCTQTFVAAALVWSLCPLLAAQELAPTYDEQVTAMQKLKPMVGTWKGSGWIEMGPRRFTFESSEVFAEKAGGLAIVVEGLHHMPIPGGQKREIHNAVAMINYDADADRYRFITQLANGRGGEYYGSITDEGDFRWVIPETPVGKMIYTISVSGDQYTETGELATPSGEQKQFFEMNLERSTP